MEALTPLVPEKEVFPVCTNGMQKGTMIVKSQSKMCNSKGHYIATYLDKPTNFKCVYLGILVAVIGGIITALVASGVGATIAGLLIATLAGVIAAYGLGGAVCSYCLNAAVWDKMHPHIIIEGKVAIIGSSKIICTPLPFLSPGMIQMFYSEDVAKRTAEIYATQNILRMFNSAIVGWGGAKLLPKLLPFIHGFTANGITSLTVFKLGSVGVTTFVLPDLISLGEDTTSDFISDIIVETNSDEHEKYIHSNEEKYDAYEKTSKAVTGVNTLVHVTNEIGTAASQPKGAAFKIGWFFEKLDPRYSNKKSMGLSSTYAKEGWSVVKADKAQKVEKRGKDGKAAISIICLDVLGSIMGKTIYKCLAKDLVKWADDTELDEQNRIGIFEQKGSVN